MDYIKINIKDKKLLELVNIHNQFPVYKDLEPFKIYDFDVVQNIHDVIVELLYALHNYFTIKDRELEKYKAKNKIGFNIDNFVNTVYFNNIMLREKITLFINYLEFFHRLNIKYLSRYYHKLDMMLNQINSDIRFEEKNDENASYEIIDVREIKENQVNSKNTRDLEKFFETPHENKNEIPSDLISELSIETIVTETPSKSNSNNLKKKKYKARKKNKQQMTTPLDNSNYNSEFVVSGEDKNIQVVIEELPTVIADETHVVVVEEALVVVAEEPSVVVAEESPVILEENTNNV